MLLFCWQFFSCFYLMFTEKLLECCLPSLHWQRKDFIYLFLPKNLPWVLYTTNKYILSHLDRDHLPVWEVKKCIMFQKGEESELLSVGNQIIHIPGNHWTASGKHPPRKKGDKPPSLSKDLVSVIPLSQLHVLSILNTTTALWANLHHRTHFTSEEPAVLTR